MRNSAVKKMKDANCGYCMRGELLDKFGIFICDLQVSSLILFKEQSKPGRCIVAYKDHVSEMIDISEVFLRQIERGERSLSIKTLRKIVKFTGCSTDYILFGNKKIILQ